MKTRIFLLGFMGSGKTTLGRHLARFLKLSFIDTDDEIEIFAGKTIAAIFEEKGEHCFRKLEEIALKKIIKSNDNSVIATGGGIILSEQNRKLMRSAGLRIFLYAPLEVIWQRIGKTTHRPLLKATNLATIYEQRMPYYMESDLVLDTHSFENAYEGARYLEKEIRKKIG